MANVKYDFLNPNVSALFPAHGWSRNSQSVKILRFPLISLFKKIKQIRINHGITRQLSIREDLADIAFYQTVYKLTVTLRELHMLIREEEKNRNSNWQESSSKFIRLGELAPIYIDETYVCLRKIADQIAFIGRYIWFEDIGTAPQDFGALKKFEKENPNTHKKKDLNSLQPICDITRLRKALHDHTAWFDEIRHPEGGNRGLRDALIHDSARQLFLSTQGTEGNIKTTAYFHTQDENPIGKKDLISTIHEITKDLCAFCKEVYLSVDTTGSYETIYGEGTFALSGMDDDITGFWPEIKNRP